uniref:Uncharacterized protein n=1 Tax=Romanomermis culicivorax TaxID=13658 RepID=A0A915I668_ROMCU
MEALIRQAAEDIDPLLFRRLMACLNSDWPFLIVMHRSISNKLKRKSMSKMLSSSLCGFPDLSFSSSFPGWLIDTLLVGWFAGLLVVSLIGWIDNSLVGSPHLVPSCIQLNILSRYALGTKAVIDCIKF